MSRLVLAPFPICCLLVATAVASAQSARRPDTTLPVLQLTNGQWYDGRGFGRRTFYVVDGVLEAARPARVDTTVDLAGGYVIPPFGDAHTHNLDGPFNLERVRDAYVDEGTFYVAVLTNVASRTAPIRSRFHRACDLDVLYANGGITSTLSHPFLAYEPRAMGIQGDFAARAADIRASRIRENDAYWFIDTREDLDAKWPRILDARPDLLKIFLLDATETPPAMPDTGLPSGRGLRPSLVAPIVDRAHAAGLRVAAHVETAADFALAARAGVDLVAHLPGYALGSSPDGSVRPEAPDRFEIGETAAGEAGRRGVVVTPTVRWTFDGQGQDSAAVVAARHALMRRNVARLGARGVRFAVGSDRFGQTAWVEITAMRTLGSWTDAELLRLWTGTPPLLFPDRKLGKLEPGYEASFLVLDGNPLERLDAVRTIRTRVKQGCFLRPTRGR